MAAVAIATLATGAAVPAQAQGLNWLRVTPPDTVPVYRLPRQFYDPPGITVGDFVVKPISTETASYDDNIVASQIHTTYDYVNTTSEEVIAESQWSRDYLNLDLRSDQEVYLLHPQEDANTYVARLTGRLDIDASSYLQLDGVGGQIPQVRAELVALRTSRRPTYNDWGGTLTYFTRGNTLIEQFQVGVSQNAYIFPEEVAQSYVAKMIGDRINLDLNSPFSPFIEFGYVRNDQAFNPDRQSYRNLTALVGTQYHLSTVVDASVEAGILRQNYTNVDFRTLVRPVATATLLWNVTPLTSITGTLQRTYIGIETFCDSTKHTCGISPNGTVGPEGSLPLPPISLYNTHRSVLEETTLQLKVEHEVWHNILASVGVGYGRGIFDLNNLVDDTYSASANMRYLINRYAEFQFNYLHNLRTANLPFDYTFNSGPFAENIVSVSLKFGF